MDHALPFSTGLAAGSTVKHVTIGLSPVATAFAEWCRAIRAANVPGIPDSSCDAASRASGDAIAEIAALQSHNLADLQMKLHAFRYETTAGPSQSANALFDSVLSDLASLGGENSPASESHAAPMHPCWKSNVSAAAGRGEV